MKTIIVTSLAAAAFVSTLAASEISLQSAPPVVVKTVPTAGDTSVDPALAEIRVTYSKAMQDGSWSWVTNGQENYPQTTGKPRYLADGRTCVLPVKLQPRKFYAIWLNSGKFGNFQDTNGTPAVPYLLAFCTGGPAQPGDEKRLKSLVEDFFAHNFRDITSRETLEWGDVVTADNGNTSIRYKYRAKIWDKDIVTNNQVFTFGPQGKFVSVKDVSLGLSSAAPAKAANATVDPSLSLLNEDQRAVLAWTDRQFRSFFDARTFEGWSDKERADLETRLLDTLKGPQTREYYQAINTLAALRSTKALPALCEIAFNRADKDCRDRWMAIRALGIIGDKAAVPDLIHLVYHGNVNTRWWAQISLVRLTGKNFGKDWNAWGKWWNESGGQPPYKPEIIRWWNGQPEPDKLAESLDESDRKFFEDLKAKSGAAPASASSADVAARLRVAAPVMEGIRGAWSAAVAAIRDGDATNALASLRTLAPRIQEFRDTMEGTSLEPSAAEALETLKPLMAALEKGDLEAARTAMEPMQALGRRMEAQIKAITEASPVPAPEPVAGLANAIVLQRDDGIQRGVQSLAASGHAVQFERPGVARYVEAVQIFASRYGTPEPPQEDFHLYLLNEQGQVLADVKFPYAMIERGEQQWYTLRTPSVEVPEKFSAALDFNPHQTKGVYLAYSATNGVACHSLIGLPGAGFEFWRPVEWMVRVSLTTEPTKAKGFQRLADWKPPVEKDPFAGCRVVSFGGDLPDDMQSYGGRGPAIRFKPAESLPGVRPDQPLLLKGVRLYASRYGGGYSPEEAKLRVFVRDAKDAPLAEAAFAYAQFSYRAKWVDLLFDKPVTIPQPGEPLTIAFDPEATRQKGIYFHCQNNPATSHSLVGTVSGGFKELSDREWLVRACFEASDKRE